MQDEKLGKFEQFIDIEAIRQPLSEVLPADEVDIVVRAIQKDHAQFVVDAIVSELNQRVSDLYARRNDLKAEVAHTDKIISLIESTLGMPESKSRVILSSRADLFRINGWTDEWDDCLRKEPPFVLWLEPVRHSEYLHHPTLWSWVRSHSDEIKQKFGSYSTAFTRAARCLERVPLDEWGEGRGISGIINHENEQINYIGIVVGDTRKFIGEALDISQFGYKSAAAVLCIADMQREEFGAPDLTEYIAKA
jgi:hypothetical protein